VSLESLAASTVPEWPVLSHGARQAFLGRIAELLRRVAANEMRGQFVFDPVLAPVAEVFARLHERLTSELTTRFGGMP
jgi:hypothetical protein